MIYFIFYFLAGSVLWHLIWESAVAPSLRVALRYKLFALRDRIRWQHAQSPETCPEDVYRIIEAALNNSVRLVAVTDISFIARFNKALGADKDLKDRIKKRRQIVEECKDVEVQEIRKLMEGFSKEAILINNGGWLVYVVPVVISIIFCEQASRKIKSFLFVKEHEMDKLADGLELAPV